MLHMYGVWQLGVLRGKDLRHRWVKGTGRLDPHVAEVPGKGGHYGSVARPFI